MCSTGLVRRALRFVVALVLGLAILTWAASVIVQRTTREWFEKDMRLRAELAVSGARRALVAQWDLEHGNELASLLEELTHDERIMAAATCAADLRVLAKTSDFPPA